MSGLPLLTSYSITASLTLGSDRNPTIFILTAWKIVIDIVDSWIFVIAFRRRDQWKGVRLWRP